MPAYDIGPRIGIEGEKEFRNSIKAIDSEVRALGNELKTLSKEYDKNDTSIEAVSYTHLDVYKRQVPHLLYLHRRGHQDADEH